MYYTTGQGRDTRAGQRQVSYLSYVLGVTLTVWFGLVYWGLTLTGVTLTLGFIWNDFNIMSLVVSQLQSVPI